METNILNICDELTIWLADGQVVKGYYTCCRVSPEEVPAGLYKYDIREDDYGNGDLCEIKDYVWVNHNGTLLTAMPVNCKDGIEILEWDFSTWSE